MEIRCRRCGGEIDAKSAKRQYCDACRKQAAVERSVERSKAEGNTALAEERRRLGLTAREMAEYLGIDRTAYYKAERYGMEPGAEVRRRIEDKLGIAAEELFGELMYLKRCWSCGDVFQTQNPCGRICPACREARQERPAKPVRARRNETNQERIARLAREAREAGMSYGQYVTGMEKGKKK